MIGAPNNSLLHISRYEFEMIINNTCNELMNIQFFSFFFALVAHIRCFIWKLLLYFSISFLILLLFLVYFFSFIRFVCFLRISLLAHFKNAFDLCVVNSRSMVACFMFEHIENLLLNTKHTNQVNKWTENAHIFDVNSIYTQIMINRWIDHPAFTNENNLVLWYRRRSTLTHTHKLPIQIYCIKI